MSRHILRTWVPVVCLLCFLTLVLPVSVTSVRSETFLRGGGSGGGSGDTGVPSDGADPDDIAVNSLSNLPSFGLKTTFGLGRQQFTAISSDGSARTQGEPAASLTEGRARWMHFAWILVRHYMFSF
ncbi:MAG: hypothetical protein V2A71_09570 [Candidatus Eisenbacteria bacterium]